MNDQPPRARLGAASSTAILLLLAAAAAALAPGCTPANGGADDDAPETEPKRAAAGAPAGDGKLARATFGGGCFWCVEAVFERVEGVKEAVSGYSGGEVAEPTYEQICTGTTGHAEVCQIAYDPGVIGFEKLLEVFFGTHDPTTLNRQGPDSGTQYRSVVFYHDEEQKRATEAYIAKLTEQGAYGDPIVTEVTKLEKFWPAEEYHQDYFERNPEKGYCVSVVAPKVKKLTELFDDLLKEGKVAPPAEPGSGSED